MSSLLFTPGWWLILAGLMLPFITLRLRDLIAIAAPIVALAHIWHLSADATAQTQVLGYTLTHLKTGDYTRIFATAFAIAAFGGALFAFGQKRMAEVASALVYAGSAIAITYAGDLLTLLIFWELMAVASTLILWASDVPGARAAGLRYAAMHLFGGLVMMLGVALWIGAHGTGDLPLLTARIGEGDLAALCILTGVLVNVAAPPFSAWLADAYPHASPSGAVFLSAMTTKTAVFTLLTLFPGLPLLIPVGLFMVFYGILYAMLENDLRRILAYSIVNQVGFMVTAIGIGSPLALMGASAHAFCHIIYKALLMMSAGAVVQMTGKHRCTELGGLYHSMKLTAACGIIGALAISSLPLTSGFISKSLISAAAADQQLFWVWLALLAASAGVFLHAGIKYPWFVFFQRDSGLRPNDPPLPMNLAMLIFAALCILPGIWPELVYRMLPTLPDYQPNTAGHIVTQMQLLLFSGLAFFLLLPALQRTATRSLDMDWLYRVPGLSILRYLEWLWNLASDAAEKALLRLFHTLERRIFALHGPAGILARSTVTGMTVLWTGLLLGGYLLLYFLG